MIRRKTPSDDDRRLAEFRATWSNCFAFCWACGGRDMLETHEIVRRSECVAWRDERNYTRLCRRCHEQAHGGWLTKGVLLTLKLIFDPEQYDADWVREHAIRSHWEPEPLPASCRWFIRAEANNGC